MLHQNNLIIINLHLLINSLFSLFACMNKKLTQLEIEKYGFLNLLNFTEVYLMKIE